jgi:hypothetical protein
MKCLEFTGLKHLFLKIRAKKISSSLDLNDRKSHLQLCTYRDRLGNIVLEDYTAQYVLVQ